jgi:hypothetical protein
MFCFDFYKCGSLKDPTKKEDFVEEIAEEYEEIREEHYDSLKVACQTYNLRIRNIRVCSIIDYIDID